MTDDRKTAPEKGADKVKKTKNDERDLDAKAKEIWHWLVARKIHIIPVVLWIDAALNLTLASSVATFVVIVTYYLLFLFPGFYRKWKERHPAPDNKK